MTPSYVDINVLPSIQFTLLAHNLLVPNKLLVHVVQRFLVGSELKLSIQKLAHERIDLPQCLDNSPSTQVMQGKQAPPTFSPFSPSVNSATDAAISLVKPYPTRCTLSRKIPQSVDMPCILVA